MHRFFVSPDSLTRTPVILAGDQARQIRRVLRLEPGDHVTLLDGQGGSYDATIDAITAWNVQLRVAARAEAGGEPAVHITLYQAVLKGEHFSWALQKGTEIGVSVFVPLVCDRGVVDDLQAIESKRDRWQRIIQEAAEQCGRGRLPQLLPAQLFRPAVRAAAWANEPRLIPWEGESVTPLREAFAACNLAAGARIQFFIGPEGGFTGDEIAWARLHGVQTVTLGPRILRAETAGLVAAAAALYQAGEF